MRMYAAYYRYILCMHVIWTHISVCVCMCSFPFLSFAQLEHHHSNFSSFISQQNRWWHNVIQAATIMNDRVLMVLSGSFPTGNQFGKSREVLGTFTMAVPIVWSNGSCTAKLTTCSMLWKHQRWLNQCYCQAPHVHSCVSTHVLWATSFKVTLPPQ